MAERCSICQREEVRPWDECCPVCYEPVPETPNVRAASKKEEQDALNARYDAATKGLPVSQVSAFEQAIRSAKPVVNRTLSTLLAFLNDSNGLYVSFYTLVDAGVRRPEESEIDTERQMADQRLFPNYFKKICFGALTLDGRGIRMYGECAMVFDEKTIQRRATVFEENSLDFCRRLSFAAAPSGFRARWEDKGKLAVAKLKNELASSKGGIDFATILLPSSTNRSEPPFIEVHIYGPLHRKAVERVSIHSVGKKPSRAEKVMQKSIVEVIARAGLSANVEFVR